MTNPVELEDVKIWLKENGLSVSNETRLKECYNHITNPSKRANSKDKQWVACGDDSELLTVTNAIDKVTSDKYTKGDVELAVACTCIEFLEIHQKPRIPFYVKVLDELLD